MKSYLLVGLLFLNGCYVTSIEQKQIEQQQQEISSEFKEFQLNLLKLHNEKRNSVNLELDKYLCDYAQNHAEEMCKLDKLYHSNLKNIQKEDALFVAENIAWGYKNEKDAFNAWINSYGHKQNILNKKYKKVGFGFCQSKMYWCAVFTN